VRRNLIVAQEEDLPQMLFDEIKTAAANKGCILVGRVGG
jgi:hypothetical protein